MQPNAHKGDNKESIWIFGDGCIGAAGHLRAPDLGSTDHRGTPEKPGRTVTLTADDCPTAATWGVAFQLAGTPEQQAAALSYLEWREKQYDVRQRVDVYGGDGEVAVRGALVYIASPANGNYLGPADPRVIAVQIATSRGPSGPNCEYLFKLADAMRAMGVPDPDLFDLEEMVRREIAALARQELAEVAAAGVGVSATDVAPQRVGGALAATGEVGVAAIVAAVAEACVHEDFRRWHAMVGQSQPGIVGTGRDDGPLGSMCDSTLIGDSPGLHPSKGVAGVRVGVASDHAVYSMDAVCGSAGAASEPG